LPVRKGRAKHFDEKEHDHLLGEPLSHLAISARWRGEGGGRRRTAKRKEGIHLPKV